MNNLLYFICTTTDYKGGSSNVSLIGTENELKAYIHNFIKEYKPKSKDQVLEYFTSEYAGKHTIYCVYMLDINTRDFSTCPELAIEIIEEYFATKNEVISNINVAEHVIDVVDVKANFNKRYYNDPKLDESLFLYFEELQNPAAMFDEFRSLWSVHKEEWEKEMEDDDHVLYSELTTVKYMLKFNNATDFDQHYLNNTYFKNNLNQKLTTKDLFEQYQQIGTDVYQLDFWDATPITFHLPL